VVITASPAETSPESKQADAVTTLIGQVLDGKYQVSELLGKGGMGAVYRALRIHIGDEVAVKVLHREFVNDEKTIERFRREARAAAMLRHPNIVTIHDFSEGSDDVPAYIVMELVEGRSLRKIIETEGALAQNRASWLLREICKGVGAAHSHEMVHRDIKPDNIIVLAPEAEERERVKVVDFGIAKLRDAAAGPTLTQTGKVIGTLYYMSPEQCYGEDVDSRSDVYALGVMFYEMLTGRPPFTAESATGIVAKHLTEEPPPLPVTLGIAPAVEAVIRRALSKEADERQNDARQLGRDLAVASGAAQSRDEAAYSRQTIESIQAADTVLMKSSEQQAAPEVVAAPPVTPHPARRWRWLIVAAAVLVVVATLVLLRSKVLFNTPPNQPPVAGTSPSEPWQLAKTLTHNSKVYALAFSPNDHLLATASSEAVIAGKNSTSEVRLWDTQSGQLKQTFPRSNGSVLSVAFSPDGRWLAAAINSLNGEQKTGSVELWDTQSGGLKWSKLAHSDYATSVAFAADGQMIASSSTDHEVKLLDAHDGNLVKTLRCDGPVSAIAFSPDRKTLASTSQQTVVLWDVASGTVIRKLSSGNTAFAAVAFSSDGRQVAASNIEINIWDAQSGELKQTLRGHNDIVDSLSFAPDGKLLASGSYDTTAVLWNPLTGVAQRMLNQTDRVTAVAFSHHGRMLATAGLDKTARLWQ
jgi:dipeptidyl aminopeptidase/acylaminoacyl peptidase